MPLTPAELDYFKQIQLEQVRKGAEENPLRVVTDRSVSNIDRAREKNNLDLRVTKHGVIADEENVLRIMRGDPRLQGIVRFDEFAGEMILARPISDGAIVAERNVPRAWTDADTVTLQTYLQRHHVPRMSRDKIEAVVAMFARHHCAVHPVRNYLQALQWDQRKRIDHWLIDYLGADSQPEEYLKAVGARFLISAVARIFEPGCQADSALVIEGRQGIYKSTALRILAGDEYFSDSLPADLSHKDARDHLRGKWIVELSELAQFKRAEIETVKAFISRRHEQYRPSYGRHEIKFPRQCVFAGTTNADEYLVDQTGNRRFWVVAAREIDLEALKRDRDQLWAEAVARYRAGDSWHLTGDAADIAAAEAEQRVAHDPWTAYVDDVLKSRLALCTDVTPGEVLAMLDLSEGERTKHNAARVAQILRDLGMRKGKRHKTRGQTYVRG
jgi:putative DNA primase/helicase